jgi:hypothetical protein
VPGELLWEHAEEFLDRLDAAALNEKGPSAEQLLRIVNLPLQGNNPRIDPCGSIPELRAAARRIVAIQCTTFVLDSDLGSERWRPYADWLAALKNDDTIITFNYDPVLERLNQDYGPLRFRVPAAGLTPAQREPSVNVFKLHGSVTWKREANKIVPQQDWEFGAKCDPDELAIATPGPSKHTHVTDLFMPLWRMAEKALAEADAVVFIGYRFPPSDAFSRERLLRAPTSTTRTSFASNTCCAGQSRALRSGMRVPQKSSHTLSLQKTT